VEEGKEKISQMSFILKKIRVTCMKQDDIMCCCLNAATNSTLFWKLSCG